MGEELKTKEQHRAFAWLKRYVEDVPNDTCTFKPAELHHQTYQVPVREMLMIAYIAGHERGFQAAENLDSRDVQNCKEKN